MKPIIINVLQLLPGDLILESMDPDYNIYGLVISVSAADEEQQQQILIKYIDINIFHSGQMHRNIWLGHMHLMIARLQCM